MLPNSMNESRFKELCELNEQDYDFTSKDFTISEMKEIIGETPLTERDRHLAVSRFVNCMTYQDISFEHDIPIETVRDNIPKIDKLLKKTCKKIFKK